MNCCVVIVFVIFIVNGGSAQEIFEKVEAVAGRSAELPCNVTADRPDDKLNIMAWYKDGAARAFYSSRDLRGTGGDDPAPGGGPYRLVTGGTGLARLQIVTVLPSDAGLYHCFVDFATSPSHKTFVQLDVIEPPRNLWVKVADNGTESHEVARTSSGVNVSQNIGPYYVGDTLHLVCVALGGKPRASLSWRMEGRVLNDTNTALSDVRVRSDLWYGPLRAEDHGRVVTCQARSNLRTAPLTVDLVLDVLLPPELVTLRVEDHEGGRVRAGETLVLHCRILGARPPPAVTWRIGDSQLHNLEQNITTDESQRLVTSDIQLTIDREYDELSLTCCVPAYTREEDTFVCAEKLPLTVLYPPVVQIVVEREVDSRGALLVPRGTDLRMACTFRANPRVYRFTWFHEEDTVDEKDTGQSSQAYLELPSVDESDAGEYVCGATNDEGTGYSEPVRVEVVYPAYCEDETVVEYGVGGGEAVNISCKVKGSPEPSSYRWALLEDESARVATVATLATRDHATLHTDRNVLLYRRPNTTIYSTIFCWGENGVQAEELAPGPCTILVTEETAPLPPADCRAESTGTRDVSVRCHKGHDGGLPQQFKLIVQAVGSEEPYVSITSVEPQFVVPEPKVGNYTFVVSAFNEKGESASVNITSGQIVDTSEVPEVTMTVSNIATLALALCGGVLLVALAACGLVLCAHGEPRPSPPAPNTEESNCETYGSEDESECIVRRTDSFRRAVAPPPHPPKKYEVRRTSSFHSARHWEESAPCCADTAACRNSLQNISRKRDLDCDHIVVRLPPDADYNVPARPMNTFYTMPRKIRHKAGREISDEASEMTQTSDGFSLPPPPDEYGTYRAATRIKDIPSKVTPTYTTIKRNNSLGTEAARQQYTDMSPMNMNTVGIPSGNETRNILYGIPSGNETRNTLYGIPSGNETRNTSYGISSGNEMRNTLYGIPSGNETRNTLYGIPSGNETRNTLYGIPSGNETRNTSYGISSGNEMRNTLYAYSDDDHHQQVTTNPFDDDSS